jgi:hypothetical protein
VSLADCEHNGIKAGNKSFQNVTRSNIWEGRWNIKISFCKKPVVVKDSSESRCGIPWPVNMKTVVFWDVRVTCILLSPRGFFLHTEEGSSQVLTYRCMEIELKRGYYLLVCMRVSLDMSHYITGVQERILRIRGCEGKT